MRNQGKKLKHLLVGASSVSLIVLGSLAMSQNRVSQAQPCVNDRAGNYPCKDVHLAAKINLNESGLEAFNGNDIWGWTDPETGREYAIMGLSSKTAFVDVTNAETPIHLGDLPTATSNSLWRDVKVFRNHAFIVSEAFGHGLQVFDLTRLRNVAETVPAVFEADAHYTDFGSAHNIVINEDTGFAYAVGSDTCDAGMHVVNIQDPQNPTFSTCIDKSIFENVSSEEPARNKHGEDYTHDAQCVVYNGPDAKHHGKEVCVCSNADTVNIVDVTDKANATQLSVKAYEGLGYTHQGWLTEDQRYFILGDELDEIQQKHTTKTIIWDVADLENPKVIGTFFSDQKATDHNLYVRGNILFQANYDAGLRILDLAKIADADLSEIAYFDTMPDSNQSGFTGAWSVYPYFQSNTVVVSNINGYLYVLKLDPRVIARM